MSHPAKVKTDAAYPLPEHMRAWVLGDPGQLSLVDKPIPMPGRAEVLVHIDAVAICATDLEIIHHGAPAMIGGGEPFNKMFTPGHEYMGTVAALGQGVDEYRIGQRVTVEVHAGCGQCKRCREGMYTACLNYGLNYGDVDKGHRANGFTTDGGFAEYAVNNVNTLIAIPDSMSDAEATLVVTAGTAMYGLTELGGLVAGEKVCAWWGRDRSGCSASRWPRRWGHRRWFSPGPATTACRRQRVGRGSRDQCAQRGCRGGGAPYQRRQGTGLRAGVLWAPDAVNQAARMLNRGGPHLPRRLPAPAGVDRRRLNRAQQHLPLWHPRRGQKRHAPRRGVDVAETLRRHQDPHPHLRPARTAHGPALRPRTHRRCDQGGGHDAQRRGNSQNHRGE